MSKLKDLIKKSQTPYMNVHGTATGRTVASAPLFTGANKTNPPKPDPFAKLQKQVAASVAPEKKKVSFNLSNKKTVAASPAAAVQGEVAILPSSPGSVATSPAPSQAVADKVAAIKEAKEFISEDQPDEVSQKAVEQLRKALDALHNSMDDKEFVGEAIKSVMINLQQHEFLKDMMAPEDIGAMVRGLRNSYGTTIAKKSVAKGKRAQNSADVDDVMALLGETGFSIG